MECEEIKQFKACVALQRQIVAWVLSHPHLKGKTCKEKTWKEEIKTTD